MDILTSSKLKGERASSNLVARLAAKRPHQVGDFRSGFLQKRFIGMTQDDARPIIAGFVEGIAANIDLGVSVLNIAQA